MTTYNEWLKSKGRDPLPFQLYDLPRADVTVIVCEGEGSTRFLCREHYEADGTGKLWFQDSLPENSDLICDECRRRIGSAAYEEREKL